MNPSTPHLDETSPPDLLPLPLLPPAPGSLEVPCEGNLPGNGVPLSPVAVNVSGPRHPIPNGFFSEEDRLQFLENMEGWDIYYEAEGGGYGWYWLISDRHACGLPNGVNNWGSYYRSTGAYRPDIPELPSTKVITFVRSHYALIS